MNAPTPGTTYLHDYQPPHFSILQTDLRFDLYEDYTLVTAQLQLQRLGSDPAAPLFLHGQELELLDIALDGEPLPARAYEQDAEGLTLFAVPAAFSLTTRVKIYPHKNTALEGLYRSRGLYCTQCEAEGFRKITFYLDRPDAMSSFTTRITADKTHYPVLLSNGNLIEQADLPDGRHMALWQDPFKKPAYLFALVAGHLAAVKDNFVTQSGRTVALHIYVEDKDLDKCQHAMTSLKNAMAWDERVYGREYDLDIFMIVAVDDFNMGAMENKGLNIFNTSCVLAKPETTTDAGFARVESVVAHEYFHNWSGNRVTCRDWFQLSLKEGFTVFRDEEFSADMLSRTVKRVESVAVLRTAQFAEDAGPMAHPVRPASYIEISNFYTLTVYEKGAEIVRMLHTLLGPEQFRQATDHYFTQHDGEAATIEQFIACMEAASGRDFQPFMQWYHQAGTPQVNITGDYRAEAQEFILHCRQSCPSTPEARSEDKKPLVIPLAMGLLGEAGALPLRLPEPNSETADNTHCVLELTQTEQRFVFTGVTEAPVPSLFRNFSAPVKWHYPYTRDDLLRILLQDTDGFNRWDAIQQLALQVLEDIRQSQKNAQTPQVDQRLVAAYTHYLASHEDPAMVALMLELPSEAYLAELQNPMDIQGNHQSREFLRQYLARELSEQWRSTYLAMQDKGPYSPAAQAVARRSLKNLALQYASLHADELAVSWVKTQFDTSTNMTDKMAALKIMVNSQHSPLRALASDCLAAYFEDWQHEPLVVNLWLQTQACAPVPQALAEVKKLLQHPAYDAKNPNKIRSLIGAFANSNLPQFHNPSGEGYVFLADQVLQLNQQNPQIAARLLAPLTKWARLDETRQIKMREQLMRIAAAPDLSKDVFEVVTKSLAATA
jgi:aminopeptidase N